MIIDGNDKNSMKVIATTTTKKNTKEDVGDDGDSSDDMPCPAGIVTKELNCTRSDSSGSNIIVLLSTSPLS